MKVEIAKLKLKADPHRAINQAAVESLAASMKELGQLSPIFIDKSKNVIAGRHRIAAAKRLGWKQIEATVSSLSDLQNRLAHVDENLERNEGTALERGRMMVVRKGLYESLHPEARQGGKKDKQNKSKETISSFAADTAKKLKVTDRSVRHYVTMATRVSPTADAALKKTGLDNSITDLLALSKVDAKKQVQVVNQAAKKGQTIKQAVRALKKAAQVKAVKAYKPPKGQFAVVVADPSWPYEKREGDKTSRGQASTHYPPQTIQQICKQKPPLAKDSILWLWVTNAHLLDGSAHKVMKAWGVTPKTILTWGKDKMGNGDWLRGKTEHAILCVKGRPTVHLTNQTTLLQGPPAAGAHSSKPASFYSLVESLCPGTPKLELNSRLSRKGWATSGAEAGALDKKSTHHDLADIQEHAAKRHKIIARAHDKFMKKLAKSATKVLKKKAPDLLRGPESESVHTFELKAPNKPLTAADVMMSETTAPAPMDGGSPPAEVTTPNGAH